MKNIIDRRSSVSKFIPALIFNSELKRKKNQHYFLSDLKDMQLHILKYRILLWKVRAPRVVDVSKIERVRFLIQKQQVRKYCTKHFPRGIVFIIYVVVQFYPWFKFSFLLFLGMVMYDNNMIMSLKQKKRKFEPRIKCYTGAEFPRAYACIPKPVSTDKYWGRE